MSRRERLVRRRRLCVNAIVKCSKATDYATRACELTDWKESGYLDTLAAACAASGDFDAAVKWQLKSIELAPDEQKAELRERLERYRAKEPNRPS